jgi:leader peptidase (prepilin peptidase)/N-methyltransferase
MGVFVDAGRHNPGKGSGKEMFREITAFLLGSIIGSFLSVCIFRIPRGESIIAPGSHCPLCGSKINWYDNIPIVSYIVLLGRCRSCKGRISPVYPTVELLTATSFLILIRRYGVCPDLFIMAALTSALIVISFIDLKHHVIPDVIVYPGMVVGAAWVLGRHWNNILYYFIGWLLGGGILYLAAVASKGGMGGGDVKLGAMLGLFAGWEKILVALFLSFLFGSIVGLVLIALRKKGRKDPIPFGPFLSIGGFISIIWGTGIWDWYMGR